MGEIKEAEAYEEELIDYEEEDEKAPDSVTSKPGAGSGKKLVLFILTGLPFFWREFIMLLFCCSKNLYSGSL